MTVVFQPPAMLWWEGVTAWMDVRNLHCLAALECSLRAVSRETTFRGGDRAPQERMGGRISEMAGARFVGAPYVYVWADGVYLQARMEPQAECMLVLMGATPEGKKELIGFQTGMRGARKAGRSCSSI
jgi:hypothetical protein